MPTRMLCRVGGTPVPTGPSSPAASAVAKKATIPGGRKDATKATRGDSGNPSTAKRRKQVLSSPAKPAVATPKPIAEAAEMIVPMIHEATAASAANAFVDEDPRTIASALSGYRCRARRRALGVLGALPSASCQSGGGAGRKRLRGDLAGSPPSSSRTPHPLSSSSTSSSSLCDVLAVVLAVNASRYPNPADRRPTAAPLDLIVGDGSLPRGRVARVILKLSSRDVLSPSGGKPFSGNCSDDDVATGGIQAGDVVLFRSVVVKRDFGEDGEGDEAAVTGSRNGPTPSKTSAVTERASAPSVIGIPTVACELYRPWWAEGTASQSSLLRPYVRLSRAAWHDGAPRKAQEVAAPPRRDVLMGRVERLATWYLDKGGFAGGVGGCIPHSLLPVLVPSSPAVCRRRRLRDISAPGLLSDVAVVVLSYEGNTPRPPGWGGASPGHSGVRSKGQHWRWNPPSTTSMVSLSDGPSEADLIALYDCRRLGAELQSAVGGGKKVLVTRVMSVRVALDDGGIGGGSGGGLALSATDESTVVILDESGDASPRRRKRTSPSGYASQVSQTQGITQTQLYLSPMSPTASETVVVTSAVSDIFVPSLSISLLDSECFVSPSAVADVLIDTTCPGTPFYRSAVLTLDAKAVQQEFSAVKADQDVVRALCGSVLAADLVGERDDSRLRWHVYYLLQGMIGEAVLLRWTLCRQGSKDRWEVVDVMLPKL